MGAIADMVQKDRDEWREIAKRFETALRRIRSLDEKNVPKFAEQIAREALPLQRPKHSHQGETK